MSTPHPFEPAANPLAVPASAVDQVAGPRIASVQCLSPAGLHQMAYREWGAPDNPRVLLCVHGLTRVGADFDTLAQRLGRWYRVVSPDVVGRGASDWLRDPQYYAIPQYVADMVTLIARLGVPQVDWFGTSMGGMIGMVLAGFPGTPIGRMLLNDIGPHIEPAALERIGEYLGKPARFATRQQGIDYLASVAASFGPHTAAQWQALNTPLLRERAGEFHLHYDPAIAEPFNNITPDVAAAGERTLWRAFEAFEGAVLVVRGAQSDLLTAATVADMMRRGHAVSSVEIPGVGHAPTFVPEAQIRIAERFFVGTGA